MSDVAWRATTPGGPGGQHANRTLSRVEVRFDVERSAALGPRQRARLLERLGPVVRASSADERSQLRNRQIALERLAARLADALRVEAPRHATKPSKGAKERRLQEKHRRSEVKRGRGRRAETDE
jgi:ribosome-associated protein